MDSSESSSEDECNIYVNAASKLNALKQKIKSKNEDDDVIIDDDSINSTRLNVNETDNESTNDSCYIEESTNDSCYIDDSRVKNTVNCKKSDSDLVICIEDDVSCSDYSTTTRRITRSAKRKMNAVPKIIDSVVILNDSIEEELNKTYNLQEENDSYIIIGSPPPTTKCDSDNYEVSVKVLWRSNKMNRFEIRRYETFQKVFRHFANIEGVPENQILITKKDKRITPFDTPASIDWSVIDILDGGIVSAEIATKNNENSSQDKLQGNICKIKVQISDKKSLLVPLKTNERFIGVICSCAEQLNIPESKLKFYFDGELIDVDETPESLDFDDEACVDLKISE